MPPDGLLSDDEFFGKPAAKGGATAPKLQSDAEFMGAVPAPVAVRPEPAPAQSQPEAPVRDRQPPAQAEGEPGADEPATARQATAAREVKPLEDTEFKKGIQTGITGAKQMAAAAATIPIGGAFKSLTSELAAYDKVDAGEPTDTKPGEFAGDRAQLYANASPEARAQMRNNATNRLISNKETSAALIDAWKLYGDEMQATQGKTPNFTDIDSVKGFGEWLSFNVGQGIPYMAASTLSAVIGGVLGGPTGAAAGIGLSGYAMGVGDTQSSLMEKGIIDRGDIAMAAAVPYAALDYLGPVGRSFRKLTTHEVEEAAKTYFRRLGREVPTNAVEEFINEAGQEIVKDVGVTSATGEDLLTWDNVKNWFNNGMGGMAMGAPGGVATAGIPNVKGFLDGKGKPAAVAADLPPEERAPQPPGPPAVHPTLVAEELAKLSDEDRASPIPDQLIAEGRAALRQANGEAPPPEPTPVTSAPSMVPSWEARDTLMREGRTAEAQAMETELRRFEDFTGPTAAAQPEAAPAPQAGAIDETNVSDALDGAREQPSYEQGRDYLLAQIGDGQGPHTAIYREALRRHDAENGVETGTRDNPTVVNTPADLEHALTRVDREATRPQAEAENHEMTHIRVPAGEGQNLDISIHRAKGTERSGTRPDGSTWTGTTPENYGYIKGTEANDGENFDVYTGKGNKTFVIDQFNPETGEFDEHKGFVNVPSREEAIRIYDAAFSDGSGPRRRGGITEMSNEQLYNLVHNGDLTQPLRTDTRPGTVEGTAAPAPALQSDAEFMGEQKRGGFADPAEFMPDRNALANLPAQYRDAVTAFVNSRHATNDATATKKQIALVVRTALRAETGAAAVINRRAGANPKTLATDLKTLASALKEHAPTGNVPAVKAPPLPTKKELAAMRHASRSQAAKKAIETRKAAKTTLNLAEFIAASGGIKSTDANIGDIHTLLGRKQHLVPLFAALIRKEGKTLDQMRESAEEAGYIGEGKGGEFQTTDIGDLLAALDRQLRGTNVYAKEHVDEGAAIDRRPGDEQELEREAEALRTAHAVAAELGMVLTDDEAQDAGTMIRQEIDPEDAVMRVIHREGIVETPELAQYIDGEDIPYEAAQTAAHATADAVRGAAHQEEGPGARREPGPESRPAAQSEEPGRGAPPADREEVAGAPPAGGKAPRATGTQIEAAEKSGRDAFLAGKAFISPSGLGIEESGAWHRGWRAAYEESVTARGAEAPAFSLTAPEAKAKAAPKTEQLSLMGGGIEKIQSNPDKLLAKARGTAGAAAGDLFDVAGRTQTDIEAAAAEPDDGQPTNDERVQAEADRIEELAEKYDFEATYPQPEQAAIDAQHAAGRSTPFDEPGAREALVKGITDESLIEIVNLFNELAHLEDARARGVTPGTGKLPLGKQATADLLERTKAEIIKTDRQITDAVVSYAEYFGEDAAALLEREGKRRSVEGTPERTADGAARDPLNAVKMIGGPAKISESNLDWLFQTTDRKHYDDLRAYIVQHRPKLGAAVLDAIEANGGADRGETTPDLTAYYADQAAKGEKIKAALATGKRIAIASNEGTITVTAPDQIKVGKQGVSFRRGKTWNALTGQQVDAMAAQAGFKPQKTAEEMVNKPLFKDNKGKDLLDVAAGRAEGDSHADRLKALKDRITVYASGMSRPGDMVAGAKAWGRMETRGIGVEATELSGPALKLLAERIANIEVKAFVDSGAFNKFRKSLKTGESATQDFDKVMQRYADLAEAINEANEAQEHLPLPLFVMPDVVGDQAATLGLLRKYAADIKAYATTQIARPVVALQTGALSLSEMYRQAVEIIGSDDFISGIPSNEKAVSAAQLRELLQNEKPKALHFLGAAHENTLAAKLDVIAEVAPDIEVSADANILRSALYGREDGADGDTRGEMVVSELVRRGGKEFVDQVNGPQEPKPAGYGAKNTTFTQDAADKARELLRRKLSGTQLNTGIDPEIVQAGITLAGYHIEAGARSFTDFAKAMIADLGAAVQPYLRSWYEAARHYPGFNAEGMSTGEEISDALRSSENLERDSGLAGSADAVRPADISDAGRRNDEGAGGEGDRTEGAGRAEPGSGGLFGDRPAALGEGGDQLLPGGPSRVLGSAADSGGRRGSGDSGLEGLPLDRTPKAAVGRPAQGPTDLKGRAELQRDADRVAVEPGNLANIRETLPLLLPEQQDDVFKAEQRFAEPNAFGFLLTNATGTGKTYSGGGIIKRMVQQGKDSMLIMAPSQGILDSWIDALKDLGVKAAVLDGIADFGNGISATTYANVGENDTLADREYDLVVPDEAHNLSQNEAGEATAALRTLRAITNHPDGIYAKSYMVLRKEFAPSKAIRAEIAALSGSDKDRHINSDKISELEAAFKEALKPAEAKRVELMDDLKKRPRSKVVFLSATPFAYDKNVDYAEGYLFDYPKVENKGGYNVAEGKDAFFVQHFGYRMRTGKLTQPESGVESDVMEREFHEWLKREGALSGRALEVNADYDRKFVLVDDAIGNRIDAALDFLATADKGAFRPLWDAVMKRFNYLNRMQLLEAIKAHHAVPFIQKNLDLGRKVVVFHDYNVGGGFNPFAEAYGNETVYVGGEHRTVDLSDLHASFLARNPGIDKLNFSSMRSPIETIKAAFPTALFYNGTESTKNRREAKILFNKDGSGRDIIVVQALAGQAGISLHDVTGKHQRALINLGMPTRPTAALQEEGRIYRTGQVSDAIMRYFNTGTNWERWTFASKIAERAGTAENLAMGNDARTIKQSFIDAFEGSDTHEPAAGEGKGGKAADRVARSDLTPFQRAKTHYFAQQKNAKRRDQREGKDYFATPEPVGLKMVEWANTHTGERMLEPSAGHGAIARYFPETTNRTLIEPSQELASRAALSSPGAKIIPERFEDHNIVNKYDGIVMNPPFGTAAKTAIEHVAKAAVHLRNGGRIVALIPEGNSADKRFDAWMDSKEAKGIYLVADIKLPAVAFERAGTAIRTRVVILDKQTEAQDSQKLQQVSRDYSDAENVTELFDRIENTEVPDRIKPTIEDAQPVSEQAPAAPQEAPRADPAAPVVNSGDKFTTAETVHAKNGGDLFVATIKQRVDRDAYTAINTVARKHGGWYSAYKGKGAIPGFQFRSEAQRAAFLKEMGQTTPESTNTPPAGRDKLAAADGSTGPTTLRGEKLAAAPLAKPFFSALARAIEGASQEKAPAPQWQAFIKNLRSKGVKEEEIDWSGVDLWLADQKGPVTKEQVVDFLKQNEVKVEEVVKGGGENLQEEWDRAADAVNAAIANRSSDVEQDRLRDIRDGIRARMESGDATKFGTHTLPGGENYRELLLTMPDQGASLRSFSDFVRAQGVANATPAELAEWYGNPQNKWRRQYDAEVKDGGGFTGGHFSEPNVLAHIRFNERTDADGKKVLFIEEIQSDWGQKGRRYGFLPKNAPTRVSPADLTVLKSEDFPENNGLLKWWFSVPGWAEDRPAIVWKRTESEAREAAAEQVNRQREVDGNAGGAVPAMPFPKSWQELAFKRALRWAAEHGFDKVAWTTGEQQAARYDLSKQVSEIVYTDDGRLIVYTKPHRDPAINEKVSQDKLADYIGKDAAEKLLAQKPGNVSANERSRTLLGPDLKVGGEGMKGFYDKILPAFANKYGKKWGAKVSETEIRADTLKIAQNTEGDYQVYDPESGAYHGNYATMEEAQKFLQSAAAGHGERVHSLDVTPEMRESVMGGQPLFAADGGTATKTSGITAQQTYDALRAELDRLGLKDIKLSVSDFTMNRSGAQTPDRGRYSPLFKAIQVAMKGDVKWTLDHEAIHALKDLGVIRAAEWAAVTKAAEADTARMAEITDRYARAAEREGAPDLTHDQLVEEAVADMYADWQRGKLEPKGFLRTAMARIKAWLEAARNAFEGLGFKSAEDVFKSIDSGKVGSREHAAAAQASPKDSLAASSGIVDFVRRWFDNPRGKVERMTVAPVTPAEALRVKAKTGIDIAGRTHVLASDYLNHIRASHGPESNDRSPVTPEDFARLPEILSNPDRVWKSDHQHRGMPIIVFEKKIGDRYVAAEFARPSTPELVLLSFLKRPTGSDATAAAPDLHAQDERGDSQNIVSDDVKDKLAAAGGAQTDTPAFKRWFGDSKVVDDSGKPLVVYHGTLSDFEEFSRDDSSVNTDLGEAGIFFTTSKETVQEYADPDTEGANIRPVYLAIKNPYVASNSDWQAGRGLSPIQAEKRGHDGYKVEGIDGGDFWIAFRPEQIKSAIGNNGEFNPNDPNIKRSIADENTPEGAAFLREVTAGLGHNNGPAMGIDPAIVPLPFQKDLGTFMKMLSHPRQIAAYFGAFTPVWNAGVAQFAKRDRIASELIDLKRPYDNLSQHSKERVNKVLELGRLQGINYSTHSNGTVFVKNTVGQVGVHPMGATLTKMGEEIKLEPWEAHAYQAVRKTMTKALDLFRDQVVKEFGFDLADPATPKTAKEAQAESKRLDAADEPKESERFGRLASVLGEIEEAQRKGYVPFSRYGQWSVSVKGPLGNTVYREHFEHPVAAGTTPLISKIARNRADAAIKERRADIASMFPRSEGHVIRNTEQITPKLATDIPSMVDLDALLTASGLDVATQRHVEEAIGDVIQRMSFRKHFINSKNIPGYSVDFERSLADYVVGLSGYLARRDTRKSFEEAISSIPAKQKELKAYADKWHDYIENPTEEYATLRQVGFFMYLSGRLSSAAINLTQVPLFTLPYLGHLSSTKAASAEISKAYVDVGKMVTFDAVKKLSMFDPTKAPLDVRADVVAAFKDGTLLPLETFQEMARANSRTAKGRAIRRKVDKAQEILGSAFSTAERINRIVTFIAAHRVARQPGVIAKANRILSDNQLWTQNAHNSTPAGFAKWAIDETHFVMGKMNRAQLFRGAGAAIFQFKSYLLNSLEMMWRMNFMHRGHEGKAAFAAIAVMLILTSGLWGFPGGDDLRDLIESIYKSATGEDVDIDKEFRSWLGGGTFARAASRGIVRETGVDISHRVGMGNIFPQAGYGASNFEKLAPYLGVPASLGLRVFHGAQAIGRGDPLSAAIAMSPEFAADPLRAKQWSERGVVAQSTGRKTIDKDYVTPDGTTPGDTTSLMKRFLGFQPTGIARAMEAYSASQRDLHAVEALRDKLFTAFASAKVQQEQAPEGDTKQIERLQRDMDAIQDTLDKHNDTASDTHQIPFFQTNKTTGKKSFSPGLQSAIDRERKGAVETIDKHAGKKKLGELDDVRSLY